jgi:hypothetical protein
MRTVNPRFMTEPAPFWQVTPDSFRDLFATNVLLNRISGHTSGSP